MRLVISTGSSRYAENWAREQVSWEELCTRLSNTIHTDETCEMYAEMSHDDKVKAKDVGGFVGGQLKGTKRKNTELLSRSILSLDVDYGPTDLFEEYDLLGRWRCFIHTTHSHTPEKPRYRMYFPFSRPVLPDEYEPIGRMIAKDIGIDIFDDTTYQAARLMFWPSTCAGGEFRCRSFEGDDVDPDEILGLYKDWRDTREWPVSSRQTERILTVNGKKQADPRTKPGLVGAFCTAYDIPGAIEKYLSDIYAPGSVRDRYTYVNGSTSNGLVLYEDGLFAYSNHSTDPASSRLCNAYDLVRIHLCGYEDDAESRAKMERLASQDPAVRWSPYNPFLTDPEDGLMRRKWDNTEMGNAILLKDTYYDVMRYNSSLGWCVWNGRKWMTNAEEFAKQKVMQQCEKMLKDAFESMDGTAEDSPEREAAEKRIKWATQSRSANNITHTLTLAKALMNVPDAYDFDPNPWELNTQSGIIDLESGRVTEHATWHMCTMITRIAPKDGPAPEWHAFLNRVTGGDKELEHYLQCVAGMALVGKVYEENLVMVVGPGSNGKSTLFDIWLNVLGDYGKTVRNEVLVGTRNGGEVAGINQLRGKRMVITGELEESMVMSSAVLKKLTSRDYISADIKFKEPITFKPSHTLILHTNHLPRLRSFDSGTLRRIAVCPFNVTIAPAERKTDFADWLVEQEGGQILQWMIDGAKMFKEDDMKIYKPPVVVKATKDYVEGEDRIRRFIDDECDVRADYEIQASKAFEAYAKWLKANGYRYAGGNKQFKSDLDRLGFKSKRSNKGTVYIGFRLSTDDLGFEEGTL